MIIRGLLQTQFVLGSGVIHVISAPENSTNFDDSEDMDEDDDDDDAHDNADDAADDDADDAADDDADDDAEKTGPCQPHPCGVGSCSVTGIGAKDFSCFCPRGYAGVRCERKTGSSRSKTGANKDDETERRRNDEHVENLKWDPCENDPCEARGGGVCRVLAKNKFVCECAKGQCPNVFKETKSNESRKR